MHVPVEQVVVHLRRGRTALVAPSTRGECCREEDPFEGDEMQVASTDGSQAIRTFEDHEQEELAAGIGRIQELAESLATMSVGQMTARLRQVLHWIDTDLKPHMAREESRLFPLIDARARTPWATRFVRFDHQQISAQVERLRARCPGDSHPALHDTVLLIADLSGLEALLRANFEREERFILPLLEPEADRWEPEWRD
jgi:hypothetical protein